MPIPKVRVPHVVSIGTNKYAVDLPDIYDSISSVVGVSQATASDTFVGGGSAAQLIRQGQAIRINVRYLDGTKTKTTSILCDIDKAAGAVKALKGKTIANMTIKSACLPRRARFR